MTKILYVDMDNFLVDFASGLQKVPENIQVEYQGRLDEIPGIFSLMKLLSGAIFLFDRFQENMILTFSQLHPGKMRLPGVIRIYG